MSGATGWYDHNNAPRPVPSPYDDHHQDPRAGPDHSSVRTAAFGKPLERNHVNPRQQPQQGGRGRPHQSRPGVGLPNKLYELPGSIVMYQPGLDCGIILMTGQRTVYCFFVGSQVYGGLEARTGASVCVNARLVSAGAKVPYLAACLWDSQERVGPAVMDQLIAPPQPQHLELFYKYSEDMACELEDINNGGTRKRFLSPEIQPDNKRLKEISPAKPGHDSSRSDRWPRSGVA